MKIRTHGVVATAWLGIVGPLTLASLDTVGSERQERGLQVMDHLSGGAGQPVLEALKRDYPFLAEGVTRYALGDVWGRTVLDDRTRQLAAIAAFAAQGNLPYLQIHAGYALQHGVTRDEIKEVIYLTTVTAGFPRAIDAAQALREVPDPADP
ncbi:gamma-carboxymuconolactone decarboxylase [Stutzerimonas stutzeri]|uniref:Gamma-carboxymuconolactone decarboxylase n=1 Tax=Stutzerimonas stutzeri TaxID=316 RepID=W8RCB0_STUST|nr:carboxymuconolactone decarboxylase family protein [Stutzerimonas stutzeri]AHL76077.1 gamma-carboxymuconolactone decarboxylase [Stutzerimonas stutzeri]MCQ4330571.1 carboxymuconolactone decarboxylase family protein [Stutzerimonas stutzeri]